MTRHVLSVSIQQRGTTVAATISGNEHEATIQVNHHNDLSLAWLQLLW